jgi:hypothetical protein
MKFIKLKLFSTHANAPSPCHNWLPLVCSKFETRLINAGLDIKTIKAVYKLSFLVTRNISLSVFQFKINRYILYAKSMLFRDKLAPNDLCHLCSEKQTLNHVFVACSYVSSFWREFELWWNSKNPSTINLTSNVILYGCFPERKSYYPLNYCLLVGNIYIYEAATYEQKYHYIALINRE